MVPAQVDLLRHLVCPACRHALHWASLEARCGDCGRSYPIEAGVPRMVPADVPPSGSTARQIDFFDAEDAEYEIERPRGTPALHAWMLEEKLRRSLLALGGVARGATALVVCGGSGMDAEHLARAGARVISVDIAPGAATRTRDRARRQNLDIASVVADAERLPLADRSVDLAYVHDGLHHLERPMTAVSEMARVAAHAVSVNEPARASISALAVRVGLALEEEEAGNRVARLSLERVVAHVESAGFRVVHASRYGLFYRHQPGWAMQAFSTRATFPVARRAWQAFNRAAGRYGNKLTVQATRLDPARPSDHRRADTR